LIQLAKLRGNPLRFGTPILIADTKFISLDEVPDEVKQQQRPLIQSILDAGFVPTFASKNAPTENLQGYCVFLRSRDRMTLATVSFTQARAVTRVRLQFASKRRNGSIIATNNAKRLFRLPPEIKAVNLDNANPGKLLQWHQRRIHEITDLILLNDDEARGLVQEMSRRICNYRVRLGLFVPATDDELRQSGLTRDPWHSARVRSNT
jgi:hypothetical protein